MAQEHLTALKRRNEIAKWVAREVLPLEGRVRAWLNRAQVSKADADELIQEAYCRIAMLDAIDHIEAPYAYFHSIVRNLLLRRLRRERVVPLEAFAEIEALHDDRPSPEQLAAGKVAYARILTLIAALPERCRQIVQLRKIEGWSQKQIAVHLGTTEKAVEKQVWVGVRLIRQAWADAEREIADGMDDAAMARGDRR